MAPRRAPVRRQPPVIRQRVPPLPVVPQQPVQPQQPVAPQPLVEQPRVPAAPIPQIIEPQQQLLADILQNLNTPAPQSQASCSPVVSNTNMLKRIKLETYSGASNITPWLGKLRALARINGLNTDAAQISYAHLHLAGPALEWINDKGPSTFATFKDLEDALLREYGLTDARRQRYRGDLLTMLQKDQSVQEITTLFESNWRMAYPSVSDSDSNYKLHNYLRVLNPQLTSRVGMMNPSDFQAAKDIAYQIEAYMPKIPIARVNTLAVGQDGGQEVDVITKIISQVVTAFTTATQAMEQQNQRRDQEFEEMKRTLGRVRPPVPRASPYPSAQNHVPDGPTSPKTGGTTHQLPYNPNRDYSQKICYACGQQGHTKAYIGCPKNAAYIPQQEQ